MANDLRKELTSDEIVLAADIASARERVKEQAGRLLDGGFEEEKKLMIETVKEIGRLDGRDISDESAEFAVMKSYGESLGFQEPKRGFSTGLANAYVHRQDIWDRVGKKVAIGVLAAGVIYGGVVGISAGAKAAHKASLQSTRTSLDSLISDVRSSGAPAGLISSAESYYAKGLEELAQDDVRDAKDYRAKIDALKSNVALMKTLPGQEETLYGQIRQIAKEQRAIDEADRLHASAQVYIRSYDAGNLQTVVSQMSSIDAVLNQAYTIRIVSRDGEKSGIDRYYTDAAGKRIAGYYLLVEAIDNAGSTLRVSIRNEESGSVETVRMWGERVSAEVYERVKADKVDNGRIDTNKGIVGTKDIGYLTATLTFPGVTGEGQITRW